MEKKKELKSTLTISKKGYERHKCLVNLDPERDLKFNRGEKVEVSEEELKAIGKHRWLEVNYGG